jgi:hypothetical protein
LTLLYLITAERDLNPIHEKDILPSYEYQSTSGHGWRERSFFDQENIDKRLEFAREWLLLVGHRDPDRQDYRLMIEQTLHPGEFDSAIRELQKALEFAAFDFLK